MLAGVRTRVYSIQEGWDLCCAIMRKGYEGVQNESARYNDLHIMRAFESGYCWIGLCGRSARYGRLRVISAHDTKGKKCLTDVSESKFIEALNLTIIKTKLPKSLKNYDKRTF